MSKELLLETAKNLKSLADCLTALAEEDVKAEVEKMAETKTADAVKNVNGATDAREDVNVIIKEKEEKEKYTLEDVRKALAAKSGKGMTEQVKQLLLRHGASKLSSIDTSEYPSIMEEVKSL